MLDSELKCAAQHFGPWLIESEWLYSAVAAYNAGELPKVVEDGETGRDLMAVTKDGIAIIPIVGPITKGVSSFGGASSILLRRSIRAAVSDPDVKGIMLKIDSPGGAVSGTDELGQDIFRARASGKPIAAHAEDAMASGALWLGTQAGFVSASRMTWIGSIGVVMRVEDTSKQAEMEGRKVHVIATGPMKGAFTEGVEITDDQLEYAQGKAEQINSVFMSAIAKGRGLSTSDVKELATGETWLAADAKKFGLIDDVMQFDQAMTRLVKEVRQMETQRRQASRARELRARRLAMG